jgi:hypothetical protein
VKKILSLGKMKSLYCRVELFDRKFYRLQNGKAIRQIVIHENGVSCFTDFGKEIDLEKIYSQIKLVYDPEGKIVANRMTTAGDLVAKPNSIWHKEITNKPEPMNEEIRAYLKQEAFEHYLWLKNIRNYSYEKYGK